MIKISIKDMFKAKIHLGHLKQFVCPKMKKYIYTVNNRMSILDLDLTLKQIVRSLNFIENIINNNGTILFVGTKKQASDLIKTYAKKIEMPYVNFRWLGGLLTNYKTIKKSIDKFKKLENNVNKNNFKYSTKKEYLITIKKLNRLKLNFDGIKGMLTIPNALIIVDVKYEKTALLEANRLSIPVIGIVDTNSDPDGVDYVIPGNDDCMDSIKFFLKIFKEHIIKTKSLKS